MKRLAIFAAVALAAGCLRDAVPHVPSVALESTGGGREVFPAGLTRAPWTVLVFFSADCPCFSVHEPRLRSLIRAYEPRGVRFLLVDSEIEASLARDAAIAREHDLLVPFVIDSGAVLADALVAEYATYSVVLDRDGAVRYRGGIDSDKSHLRADATPYLRRALDDLLTGNEPRQLESKALGCPLRTR
jgi:hypothetical protein